jgi:soluble lytic murein transglycosylase
MTLGLNRASAADLNQQREWFTQAWAELRTGAGPRYQILRKQLAYYPLAVYLDFEINMTRLHQLKPDAALRFLAELDDTPLKSRFLSAYLHHKGNDRHWREFLPLIDRLPDEVELQCYYYRALRDTGRLKEAWQGAARLWNIGESQVETCDPLFERWLAAEGPDDALVWSRALKAFDARNPHLIRYVKRFASPSLKPLLDELYAVYREPRRLLGDRHTTDASHAQLMTIGLLRLARVNPQRALNGFNEAQQTQPFTHQQVQRIERTVLRHSLFAQSAASPDWISEALARLLDDELTEIQLRNLIRQSDWTAILTALDWLSEQSRDKGEWRYWRARALHALGDSALSQDILVTLAQSRSYHGFLAAQLLDLPPQLEAKERAPAGPLNLLAFDRYVELSYHGREEDARLEWRHALLRSDTDTQLALARHAFDQAQYHQAIDAVISAGEWDYLRLRFPVAYPETFEQAATTHKVPAVQLMAIARRESAMNPEAVSPVGARGLMQLMPSTGRLMARKAGVKWRSSRLFEVDYNVDLASRYYRSLLDRWQGNRALALASYNAGPERVRRWQDADLPIDQWIDTLPFKETREYVRAVLAYTVIYQQLQGIQQPILTPEEWPLSSQWEW